jgi:tetratricopeptide (TPR) repeat protein
MVRLEPAVARANKAMSEKMAMPAPFEQTASQRAELDAFRRMMTISEGTFSLSVVLCNSPALRDHIIEHIRSEVKGIEVVRLHKDTRDILNFAQKQVGDARPKAIFTINMEEAIAGDQRDRVLQGLNVSREQWQATYQCPVVFWLPEYLMPLVMTHARDFWSWVSHHFEFVSEQATASTGLQDRYAGNLTLAANLDVHEKRFRIAELEQRIADAGDEPEGQLREHVSVWRNELAYLHLFLGELDAAMPLYKEQELICRRLGNLDGLQRTLGNQAVILQDRGDLDGAIALHKEQERICRQLGDLYGLQGTLGNQGVILKDRGDLDGAMGLLKEQERICRQLGNLDGLQTTLGNQAVILQARGDLDGAIGLLKEQEGICHQLGNLGGLSRALGNQALVLRARGDLDAAMTLLKEVERICCQLGNLDGLQTTLVNQAAILQARNDLDGAMALLKEQERICRQLGNLDGLSASLGNQAVILKARGDLDGAMGLRKEEERICRQLGDVEGLAISLTNQASVLRQRGRVHEALLLAEQAHQLATEHGYGALIRQIEPILNAVQREAQGA